jgi:hypothetical protein
VNWYELLGDVLAVFVECVFEFGVWVRIPEFFYGARRLDDFCVLTSLEAGTTPSPFLGLFHP